MSNIFHMSLKSIIVFFLTSVTMPVQIRNLVHHKMNVQIIGVVMNSINNLIFSPIVFNYLLTFTFFHLRFFLFQSLFHVVLYLKRQLS